jgi:hypothetical protein
VRYRKLFQPLVQSADDLFGDTLGPRRFPRHALSAVRFGMNAVRSASVVACRHFKHEPARALCASLFGHAVLPLDQAPSAAFGLALAIAAHTGGWRFAHGGLNRSPTLSPITSVHWVARLSQCGSGAGAYAGGVGCQQFSERTRIGMVLERLED